MGEPTPPRNRDQDIPARTGDRMGDREPLAPQPEPGREERDRPQPGEGPDEQGREEGPPAIKRDTSDASI